MKKLGFVQFSVIVLLTQHAFQNVSNAKKSKTQNELSSFRKKINFQKTGFAENTRLRIYERLQLQEKTK